MAAGPVFPFASPRRDKRSSKSQGMDAPSRRSRVLARARTDQRRTLDTRMPAVTRSHRASRTFLSNVLARSIDSAYQGILRFPSCQSWTRPLARMQLRGKCGQPHSEGRALAFCADESDAASVE